MIPKYHQIQCESLENIHGDTLYSFGNFPESVQMRHFVSLSQRFPDIFCKLCQVFQRSIAFFDQCFHAF